MKISKTALKSIRNLCGKTSDVLASVEEQVLLWSVRKEKVLGAYNSFMRKKRSLSGELPERWHNMSSSQAAAGKVFCYPARLRKFLHGSRDLLNAEQKQLLQEYIEEPWTYCAGFLKEALENDFYVLVDTENGEEMLLYSPAIQNLYRSGARMYLMLLFFNGQCWQTFGPIHYYRGFQPYDFHYFAKQLSPQLYQANGLSATIANNPAAFMLLDVGTENPPFAHGDSILQICAHELSVQSFDPQRYRKHFEIEAKDDVLRCTLTGADNPLKNAAVFFDGGRKKLTVRATRIDLYHRIRDILLRDFPLPEEPYWLASMNMYVVTSKILGKEIPANEYVEMFEAEEEPFSAEKQEHFDRLNAVLAEISRCRNQGIPYSPEQLAHKFGTDLDIVKQAESIVERTESKFDLEIEGGLENYQPPSPVVRYRFKSSPWENGVFVFLESPRVRQLYQSLRRYLTERFSTQTSGISEGTPSSLDDYPRWLENLYFAARKQTDYGLLNICLHLLCSRQDVMEPVRGYAAEVLRLFWQVFVRSKDPDALEAFVEDFAVFCYQILYRGGLIDIDPVVTNRNAKKAEFGMKPSSFFRSWVSLSRDISK